MNEFIEKLICRLEEEKEYCSYNPKIRDEAINKAIEIVNQLAEEYNNGWIPCSERLPEMCVPVLVCNAEGRVYIRQINWKSHGKTEIPYWSQNSTGIIAWQPLPEPYRQKGGAE